MNLPVRDGSTTVAPHTSPSEPPTASAEPVGPITSRERILTLDVLRGIALFGVLVSNCWEWFSGFNLLPPDAHMKLLDGVGGTVNTVMDLFVKGKAMTTFSFLFGLGFAVQMLRADERGANIASLYRRRLAVLFCIGALHAVLLWYSDILHVYALLGFVLLAFRRSSDRTLLVAVAILVIVDPMLWKAWPLLTGHQPWGHGTRETLFAASASALAGAQSMNPAELARGNLALLRELYVSSPRATVPWYLGDLAVFLLGLMAGRRRVFERPAAHRALFRRLAFIALPIGLALSPAVYALLDVVWPENPAPAWMRVALSPIDQLSWLMAASGYIAVVTLLVQRERWRRWLSVFSPVGRMALTNYLSQTVLCIAVFYGGGLVGRTSLAVSVAIGCAIFPVQMLWSHWWLARYRFGPMEWVWRSLTYGRMQPMRRAAGATPEAAMAA